MSKFVFPELNENALKVLEKRKYLWPKADSTVETVDEMFRRVSKFVGSAENKFANSSYTAARFEEEAFNMQRSLRFIPNTPTLINAGRPGGQLAACYVLPTSDSMEGIMDTLKAQALVQKSGGGTGFSFGCIRERDSLIKSTGMKAVGPIPVIKLMNYLMTKFIMQGGVRHGANMGVLPVDHKDIEEFITFKKEDGSCASFNVSAGVTDEFMRAAVNGGTYIQKSRSGGADREESASRILDLIAQYAWESGDPGLLFLDTIERFNPTPHLGRLEATNPCGEQALLPNEACTLGHFNLAAYVVDGQFDYGQFSTDIAFGVRFLDNVIEVNSYALPEIAKMHRDTNRKIGLGVMGFADALIMMGIEYGSQESFMVASKIANVLRTNADSASCSLGRERGSFGAFAGSEVAKQWATMRNACRTTVAPTGTTAIIAGVSTGIEPVFAFGLKRQQAGMTMFEWHTLFQKWLNTKSEHDQANINEYYDNHGTLLGCPFISSHEERLFIQANDVKFIDHVKMQATWQKHIDNAISKTINMPNSATVDDVKAAYVLAWQEGCKGITVYRDGCRQNQALSININKDAFNRAVSSSGVVNIKYPVITGTGTAPNPYSNYGVVGTGGTVATTTTGTITGSTLSIPFGGETQNTIGYYHTQTVVPHDVDKQCPECNTDNLEQSGGCSTCHECGWSACSI